MDIKAVILDIDGVIVGEKPGFNTPDPNQAVIKMLKSVREKGVYLSLITSKPHFAIVRIIQDANLHNFHVTDGGSVLIDPINNIVKRHLIKNESAKKVIEVFLKNNVYVEFYTVDNYFIQESQLSEITKKHAFVLQKKPGIVKSLLDEASKQIIIKVMPVAQTTEDIKRIEKIFKPFTDDLDIYWAVHPVALPLQFGIVTPQGINKTKGVIEVAENLNIDFNNMLGVGDSQSDWDFIQLCKYGAAMGNASEELKKLVLSKGPGLGYVGPTVDENGIIDIFKYFELV